VALARVRVLELVRVGGGGELVRVGGGGELPQLAEHLRSQITRIVKADTRRQALVELESVTTDVSSVVTDSSSTSACLRVSALTMRVI
jgi:hypothetical protein